MSVMQHFEMLHEVKKSCENPSCGRKGSKTKPLYSEFPLIRYSESLVQIIEQATKDDPVYKFHLLFFCVCVKKSL